MVKRPQTTDHGPQTTDTKKAENRKQKAEMRKRPQTTDHGPQTSGKGRMMNDEDVRESGQNRPAGGAEPNWSEPPHDEFGMRNAECGMGAQATLRSCEKLGLL